MYSITTLSGGQQVLMGQKENVIKAIELATGYANKYLSESENSKKQRTITVSHVEPNDSLAPKKSVAQVMAWFPTVARSQKTFWVTEN